MLLPITLADWKSLDLLLLKYATPAIIGLSLIEGWALSRRRVFDWRSLGVSVLDQVLRLALNVFVAWSLFKPLIEWSHAHRFFDLEVDSWTMVGMLFIAQEFCYYWYHRAAHRVRWFWANHVVHHSPNDLNLGAAYRIGLMGKIAGSAPFFLPLILLGFHPKAVFASLTLNLLYQFWLHTTWIPKLGPLEWVFNTPSAHRVHHAGNIEYLDANYGGVLTVFDRLFGTYKAEREDLPCRYGLVKQLHSHNLLRIEFHEWRALLADLRQARSVRAVLGALFAPPGWRPDGKGLTTDDLRRQHGLRSKEPAQQAGSGDAMEGAAQTTGTAA